MPYTRQFLSGFLGDPEAVKVPNSSLDARTITKNYASIFLFRDTSQPHTDYLMTILPMVLVNNWTMERRLEWFRNLPPNSFIEIDLIKKMCFLCSLTP